MTTQTKAPSQGLLFSEPSYSETAVWCELTEGIDPAEWAKICRKIGRLSPERFTEIAAQLESSASKHRSLSHFRTFSPFTSKNPDSLISRLKRLFCFNQCDFKDLPLVNLGPEGLNR